MASMNIGEQGIALIKSFEGCRLTAYKVTETEKYYTIGWGHYGADVKAGQTISQSEADALFLSDIQRYVKYTNHYVKSFEPTQNQFDALVSFCYNCGPGTLNKLVKDSTAADVAEKITNYNKSGGKVLAGLTRRRQAEKELFCKSSTESKEDTTMAKLIVGSARIDENGNASGGAAGDSTGKEVSTQDYYMSSKGWYVIRPKTVALANKLASAMQSACDNNNIGYDQSNRLGVIKQLQKYGSMANIAEKTESDCSSLVRGCCIQAGFDPGNFTTANEATALANSGKFEVKKTVTASTELFNGDVLVTKTKGHTVIVVSGNPRKDSSTTSTVSSTSTQSKKPDSAKSFNKSLAGKYTVTASGLNLRLGASTLKTSIAVIKKNEKVQCYGYYTLANGTKWLLVQYGNLTGYCSSSYLKKA